MSAGLATTFADLLRHYRRAAGLTQEELAAAAGLSTRTISDLERGLSRSPQKDTLQLLVDALRLLEAERGALAAAAKRGRSAPIATPRAGSETMTALSAGPAGVPFVGRAAELAHIGALLAGDGPPVLLLAGEPGIGKTRLLQEGARLAFGGGWTVLGGGCHRRSGQEPFALFTGMLGQFVARRSPAQQRNDLRGCGWLVRLLPELAETSVMPTPAWTLPPAQERRLMFAAVARLLANVTSSAGTLLVLDDLQWAGADALDLLTALVHETSTRALRIVGAYRDTESGAGDTLAMVIADLAREDLITRITVPPLRETEANALLAELLPTGSDDLAAAKRHIVQRTGGVPYFLVSCSAELRLGALSSSAAEDANQTLPWNVAESIRLRKAALPRSAQELLGVAAVAGRQVPSEVLLAAAGPSPFAESEILAALDAACRAGLLLDSGDGSYAFVHDLIREVIAADLGAARTAALHRHIAEALERLPRPEQRAAELAWHFAEGQVPERALPYAMQAGAQAEAVHAQVEAERHFREAARLARALGDAAREAEVAQRLSVVCDLSAHHDEAIEAAERALHLRRDLGDPDQLALASGTLTRALHRAGRFEEAAKYISSLIVWLTPGEPELSGEWRSADFTDLLSSPRVARAEGALSPRAATTVASACCVHLMSQDHPHEAVEAIERAFVHARAAGDPARLSHVQMLRGWALAIVGRLEESAAASAESARLAEASGYVHDLSVALGNVGSVRMAQGDTKQAEQIYQRAVQVAERVGDLNDLAGVLSTTSDLAFIVGDWSGVRLLLGRADDAVGGMGVSESSIPQYSLSPKAEWGRLWLAEGERERGVAALEEVLARGAGRVEPQILLFAEQRLAELDLLEGRAEQARARLEPYLTLLDQFDIDLAWLYPWAQLECGGERQAEGLLQMTVAEARAQGLRLRLADALRVVALLRLRQGSSAEAARALDEALGHARVIPYPYAEAKALYAYGQLHAATGEPEHARERLAAALAICERLGEGLYRPRIERALADVDATA